MTKVTHTSRRGFLKAPPAAGATLAVPQVGGAATPDVTEAAKALTATHCPFGVARMEHKYAVVSAPALHRLQGLVGVGEEASRQVDPHAQWFKDWKRADAAACSGDQDIDYDSPEWMERERLGALISNTIATTPEGIKAQCDWLDADFGYLTDDMLGGEYANFFQILKAGMEGMLR